MPQNIGSASIGVNLDLRNASRQYAAFQRQLNSSGKNNLFSSISSDAKDFENSLGKATNRVVAFASAAAVFGTLAKTASSFAQAIVEVDNSLAKINVNLGQSADSLKAFGAQVFNVARQTGQTFEVAAKAAEELARQGLGAEDTIDRLQKALVLSRIAGIDSAEAVETLTAAINSFNQSALTAGEIVNKFAAVDTKFAVSSKDLAEAVSRVGSTAQAAGVGIDQLIGLVTSLQQTTARGGATIGNGLKTIFTRIQSAPETINALESIGVAIKNTDGSLRDAISILRDYAAARDKVGEVERQGLDRTVAGTFQINILKAALADLGKEYSVYGSAVKTASGATDEAIRKNEVLNQTLTSLINSTTVSIKQFFASVGNVNIGPALATALKYFEKARAFFSGDSGSDLGKSLGDGLIKGIGAVISGPALAALVFVVGNAFKKVLVTIAQEARTLLTINVAVQARANAQKEINTLLTQANSYERQQLALATSTLQTYEALVAVRARLNQESLAGTPLTNLAVRRGGFAGKIPGFADPIRSAIARESAASGLPTNQVYVDRDSRVATFANPMGILVANRRDEPLGGYQGVNNVISAGGNPKTNGIPGFAAPITRQAFIKRGQFVPQETVDAINKLLTTMKGLDSSRIKTVALELNKLTDGFNKSAKGLVTGNRLAIQKTARATEGQVITGQSYRSPQADQFDVNLAAYSAAQGSYQSGGIPISGSRKRVLGPEELARRQNAREIAAAERQQKVQNRTLAASFALPLIGGFAEPAIQGLGFSTKGGTGGGRVAGAITYASSFAGVGALSGNPYVAGGAAGIGALIGFFSKLEKSTEELTAEIDEQIAKRNNESEALSRAVEIQEQLNDARKAGDDPKLIDKLEASFRQARGKLTDDQSRSILNITDPRAQGKAIISRQETLSNQNAKSEIQKLLLNPEVVNQFQSGKNGNETLANSIKEALDDSAIGRLSDDQFLGISKIAGGNFNNPATANLLTSDNPYDLAEASKQIVETGERFRKAADDLAPLVSQLGVSRNQITPDTINGLALALLQAAASKRTDINADAGKTASTALPKGSFLSPLNGEAFRQAAFTGRNPAANRGARAQASYDFYSELSGSGGVPTALLEGNKDYKQSVAGVQSKNLTDAIIKFLTGNNPSLKEGNLRDVRGNPNLTSIERTLSQVAGGGTSASGKAQTLLGLIPRLRGTLSDSGVKSVGYTEGVTGIIPGANYGEFTSGRKRGGTKGGAPYINSDNLSSYLPKRGGYLDRFSVPFITNRNLQDTLPTDQTRYDLTQVPRAPAGGRNSAVSAATLENLPSDSQSAQHGAALNADIEAYQQVVKDAKEAAQSAAEALQTTLNIVVTVNGTDSGTAAAIQQAIKDLYNEQASAAGKPNPPSPTTTPNPGLRPLAGKI